MADPTQPVRDLLKKGVNYLIPDNSPLAQSGDDVLTPAARAKIEEEKAKEVTERAPAVQPEKQEEEVVDFTDPNQSVAPAPAQAPVMSPSFSSSGAGLSQEAAAIDQMGQQQAAQYDALAQEQKAIGDQRKALQDQVDAEASKFSEEDAKAQEAINSFKIEPSSYFSNKSTWQKVVGGIGMFLGSITPEGARNVASIVNNEIDRDVKRQMTEYQLLKEKKNDVNNRFKQKLDLFKSKDMALLSMKQDAYSAVELQLKRIEASAKGPIARAKATQGLEAIRFEKEKLGMQYMKEVAKMQQTQNKASIPGYEGANQNPAIVKDLTDRVSAKQSAERQISNLERLLAEGSKNPLSANNELAKQTKTALAADLAKAMFGRSSDSELAIAESLIPDITSLARRDSTAIKLLTQLRKKLADDVDAAATAAGYSRQVPMGARKLN